MESVAHFKYPKFLLLAFLIHGNTNTVLRLLQGCTGWMLLHEVKMLKTNKQIFFKIDTFSSVLAFNPKL